MGPQAMQVAGAALCRQQCPLPRFAELPSHRACLCSQLQLPPGQLQQPGGSRGHLVLSMGDQQTVTEASVDPKQAAKLLLVCHKVSMLVSIQTTGQAV